MTESCPAPSQSFPLPLDALDGHLPAEDRLTRAVLFRGGIAGLVNVHGPRLIAFEQLFESARATAAATALVVIETAPIGDTWLGRWVDRHGSAAHPLQAVTIGDTLSPALKTSTNPVSVIPAFAQDGYELKPSRRRVGTLPSNLRLAGRLLSAGLGIRILTTAYTGPMTGLADTFDAFRDDLEARGIGDRVITVINTATTSAAIRQQVLSEWLSDDAGA